MFDIFLLSKRDPPTPDDKLIVDGKLPFSTWARAPLFYVLREQLENSDETRDGVVSLLLEDVDYCVGLINARPGAELDKELSGDLHDYSNMLRSSANPGHVLASDISTAMTKLESVRCKPLYDAIHDSPVGKVVLSAAHCLLQLSSKDALGDGKLSLACKVIGDSRLPSLRIGAGEDAGKIIIDNFGLIAGNGIVEIMQESVAHMVEALALWSVARFGAKRQ